MRRRRTAAVAAGVLALVAGLVAGLAVVSRLDTAESAGIATRPLAAPDTSGTPRPLTYAEGRTIHIGDRSIDTHLDLLSIDVTDDGAAFTTFDGGLWFTDGSSVTQIGLTSSARATSTGVSWGPAGRPDNRIVSESSGTRLAWLEYPRAGRQVARPEIVVYDSRQRRRVARLPVAANPDCPVCAQIVRVDDDAVYWTDTHVNALLPTERNGGSTRLFRTRVSTGKQQQVPLADYQAALRHTPRTLVVGSSPTSGSAESGVGEDFAFVDGLLVVHAMGVGDATFDAATGHRLRIAAPPRYGGLGPAKWFYLFEWLDNDRFALLDATAWSGGVHSGEDVLVCSLSGSRCTVTLRRPISAGSPIVSGLETAGAEQAEKRAISGR
jgi:hypothetical protein